MRVLIPLVCAITLLVVPVASQIHDMAVQHRVCDEHGELIEVAEPSDSAAATLEAPSRDGLAADSQVDHDAHGCGFSAQTYQPQPPDDSPAPHLAVRTAQTVAVPSATDARAPPLSFAPKTSPPAPIS